MPTPDHTTGPLAALHRACAKGEPIVEVPVCLTVFVANFGDTASFAAELDDPSFYEAGLDGLASPQFHTVLSSMDTAKLDKLRADCLSELCDAQDWEDDPKAQYVWGPLNHNVPEHGRENWTQELLLPGMEDPDFGSTIALLVVQAVEVE